MKKIILSLLLIVVGAFNFIYGQGCSQCKMVTEQATELDEASFGSNINSGILYLMLIPYILLMFLFRKRIIALIKTVLHR
jgi:hypothetical protein